MGLKQGAGILGEPKFIRPNGIETPITIFYQLKISNQTKWIETEDADPRFEAVIKSDQND